MSYYLIHELFGEFWATAFFTFLIFTIGFPIFLLVLKFFAFYTIVHEKFAQVYTLFGTVELVLQEPGLHFLWPKLTWKAFLITWLGKVYVVDMRVDQQYLRSLAVNSEEGAPMGIGVWYEMAINDPVSYLFKNENPRTSLSASVSNSTVRCLSNMQLGKMLTERHTMSAAVRNEIHSEAADWGFKLGSVYIRKVHFRDNEMIRQIESKVVNRLRQVTSAIKQDGANQVNIITSSAEKESAIEFAKAAAVRPRIVGQTLQDISKDPEIAETLFEILETQKILEGNSEITLLPANNMAPFLLSRNEPNSDPKAP